MENKITEVEIEETVFYHSKDNEKASGMRSVILPMGTDAKAALIIAMSDYICGILSKNCIPEDIKIDGENGWAVASYKIRLDDEDEDDFARVIADFKLGRSYGSLNKSGSLN